MRRLAKVGVTSVALLYFILALPSYAQVLPALGQKSQDAAAIVSAAQSRGTVRVVIMYRAPASPARVNIGTATENIPAIINENHAAQDAILSSHFAGPQAATNNALKRFDITPGFAINATLDQINALAADVRVLHIDIDRTGAPQLIQSVPLIGMNTAYTQGATGSGWAVVVMDTGTETSHTFLTGQTIQEACFSTTQGTMGSGGSTSLCPGGASSSTAVGAGANCNIAWNGCEHGTHVSGISVGLNSVSQTGQPTNGVAKSARLIPIKMYSEFSGSDCSGVSPCVLFFFSDFVSALDYVYSIRNSLPGGVKIASINLSGGGGHFSGNCDTASGSAAMKASIDNLRAAGIATVISAGNGSSRTQIGQPGCISSAIAVAASSKTDVIASYSDISTQVALFAPGGDFTSSTAPILSSVPAGFNAATFGFNCNYTGTVPSSGGSYCYLSGTSMAAPHVAGAFAAIRSVCPSSTVDQILTALINTGTPITDTRSSGTITKNRIQVNAAVTQLGCGGVGLALQVTPSTNIETSGPPGGPFSQSSFDYSISASSGSVNYSITGIPSWLNPSFASGTATTTPVTVTFSLQNVSSLGTGIYATTISFNNTSNGQGNTARTATLIIGPTTACVTMAASDADSQLSITPDACVPLR